MVDEQYVDLVPLDVPSSVKVVVSKDSGGQDPSDAYEAFLDEGYQHWQASNRSGPLDWLAVPPVQEEDATCSLCYTSGTTGHPKGVETTLRGSYLSALSNVIESNVTGESVYLWVLPMFHCCGWTFPWAMSAAMGTQYMLRSVNYDRIWDALLHGGVTHYSGAPTVQLGVVNHPKACRLPQRVCVTVAASAPTATLLRRMESLNLLPMHLYGLTETYGPSCRRFFEPAWLALPIEERAKEQAKQGHAYVTGDEVRVVRRDVPPGQPLQDVARDGKELGEIVMRGNIVMKQYYKDPTATSNATHGNYFHTGDLAVRHPGGEVQILDRGKDIIISGGENVSSLMVEEELAAHPWIEECAVVARPDPKWGECVHAFVKLSAVGRQTLADQGAKKTEMLSSEVTAFCRVKMSGFAVPKWFTILDELPKSSTGSTYAYVSRVSRDPKERFAHARRQVVEQDRVYHAYATSTFRPMEAAAVVVWW
ncbi:cellulase [Malassezia pachydermatis]